MKENSPQTESTIPFEPIARITSIAEVPAAVAVPAISPAPLRMHPNDQARLAARSEGNQLGNVETYARDFTRSEQAGERDGANASLARTEVEIKMHAQKGRRARSLRRRTEERIPQPGSRSKMGPLAIALLLFMLLGLLGAIAVEQYGASLALLETGAFAVDTVGKGILLTMTAVTVGFALKLAYGALPPYLRRWAFILACGALVGLFVTWAWNFALGAGRAVQESGNLASVQIQGSVDSGALGDASATVRDQNETAESAAWMMFFALVSMMPLTAFIGHAGVEHFIDRFKVLMPNPVHQQAEDDIRFHEGEAARLSRLQVELHQRTAVLMNAEHAAVSHSRTLYLAERARLNGLAHGGGESPAAQG